MCDERHRYNKTFSKVVIFILFTTITRFKAVEFLTTHLIHFSQTDLTYSQFSLLLKLSKFKPSKENKSRIIILRFMCFWQTDHS